MSDDNAGQKSEYREYRPWQDLDTMLSVEEARARILATITPRNSEPVALLDAHGLVLAEDVISHDAVPPFRNSAMDGYAIRAEDVQAASYDEPVRLAVVGNLPAGKEPTRTVGPGEAIRIMTGAAMPTGADTVARFEETSEIDSPMISIAGSFVDIKKAQKRWSNVREAGEDIAPGTLVLKAGTLLKATELGLLASANRDHVQTIRRPRIGILATGDEVVDPGQPIKPGQIRNSNNFMLAGLVREAGGVPVIIGIAGDSAAEIRSHLTNARDYDLLITSGGVSMGDYDVVKDVLQEEGRIDLWQVRIKPGKPMAFGHISDVPLIGLPGNPVAAFVAFLQFAKPAIFQMRGLNDSSERLVEATLLCEHENRGHRRHFVRGIVRDQGGELVVEPVPVQGSGVLTSVANANCLFVIPEQLDHAPAGLQVEVIPLADNVWTPLA